IHSSSSLMMKLAMDRYCRRMVIKVLSFATTFLEDPEAFRQATSLIGKHLLTRKIECYITDVTLSDNDDFPVHVDTYTPGDPSLRTGRRRFKPFITAPCKPSKVPVVGGLMQEGTDLAAIKGTLICNGEEVKSNLPLTEPSQATVCARENN